MHLINKGLWSLEGFSSSPGHRASQEAAGKVWKMSKREKQHLTAMGTCSSIEPWTHSRVWVGRDQSSCHHHPAHSSISPSMAPVLLQAPLPVPLLPHTARAVLRAGSRAAPGSADVLPGTLTAAARSSPARRHSPVTSGLPRGSH